MPRSWRWIVALSVGWLVFSTTCQLSAAWPFTTDDAFITLRYARHLAQGDGIVWNIGESPAVEGYSNFLYVLLAAAAIGLGYDPVITVKATASLSLAAGAGLCYALARIWAGPAIALIPVIVLTAYPGTYWWTVSGLETATYQMLVIAAMLAFTRGISVQDTPWAVSSQAMALAGGLVFLLALTRPEGPLIGIALGTTLLSGVGIGRIERRAGVRGVVSFSAAFLVPYLIYTLWKWQHFGRLVPNAAYCKIVYPGPYGQLVMDFAFLAWPFAILVALTLPRRFDLRLLPFLLLPALYALVLYRTDPIIGNWNRHFLAAFAVLLVAAAAGMQRLATALPGARPASIEGTMLIAALALAMLSFHPSLTTLAHDAERYAQRMTARATLAEWLHRELPAGASYLIGDAGLVPYLNDAPVIDAYCLNSREMTSPPIAMNSERFVTAAIRRKPAAIIVPSNQRLHLDPHTIYPIFTLLIKHPEFLENYVHATTLGAPDDTFQYWIFRLRGSG
ncbi:hypothetical protein [Azospira restricta]|uniref:Glycosyltransferase RgtA/B/C/D-like domain-containing protein n=1 Tax=Azospira restricta TaxID=404405 RepID=A0A974Y3L4_9RHOO|nr:hypothetical protein [Azospira restricta]QRJ63950.1 hypothetical protein IWH25_00895 [Azospira restricta]